MKKTKVLVLGNDPQINSIEFDKLDPSVITLGLNRIWLKHVPHYLFFNDIEILTELNRNPEILTQIKSRSIVFSSDWLSLRARKIGAQVPNWVKVFPRHDRYRFVDSASTAIRSLSRNLIGNQHVTYYVAGVSLTWKEPSHFWKDGVYNSVNKYGPDWYLPRFEKMYENFENLRSLEFKIVSVTPNSKLNKLFRYEGIENLYKR